jgi:histidinol-phosphate/aromatic aminotransferase/cobyric acid decarboxylase-like protein
VAAHAAYRDEEHIALSRQRNAEARATLYAVLEKLGHKAIPNSQANFIAFEAKGGSPQLVARLRSEFGIGLRTYEFLGKSWVRASMGTKEEMESLVAALRKIG